MLSESYADGHCQMPDSYQQPQTKVPIWLIRYASTESKQLE